MKLIDPIIKSAKPREKPYTLPDGQGLVLYVQPTGSKWWRFRYRFLGKAKKISLGVYPEVSLKEAREKLVLARELLKQGIDPSQHRREQNANNFEVVAQRWRTGWSHGKHERHVKNVTTTLETDIFPVIGRKPVNEITAPMLLLVVKKIEARGTRDSAKRALNICGQVFRYAVAHGLAERNPAADIKPSDVLKPHKKSHFVRVNHKELPELLRKIDTHGGQPLTRLALKLMALTFLRANELIEAKWSEIEIDEKLWRLPAERMKKKRPHLVPLSDQAIRVLNQIKELSGNSTLVFPGERGQGAPMSASTLLQALYRMGYKGRMTTHGFRGVASTILHEKGYPHAHIELQLAHSEGNAVSAAYNHSTYLEQRAKMMQEWADYLDMMKEQ